MPMFQIKYRAERPEQKRVLTAAQKKLPVEARKAMGLTETIPAQIGLTHLRNLELAGVDPQAEAQAWADGLESDVVVLDVQAI